jgi:hypothetical protein
VTSERRSPPETCRRNVFGQQELSYHPSVFDSVGFRK